jgi:hypothetical protein
LILPKNWSESSLNLLNKTRKHRPFGVTLLNGLVLTLAVINLVRMGQALMRWQFLEGLLPFTTLYLVISGLIWGAASVGMTLLIWFGWSKAAWLSPVFLVVYSFYKWAERLLMPGYPERNMDWPFALVSNALLIAWSFWIMKRPRVTEYFEVRHE